MELHSNGMLYYDDHACLPVHYTDMPACTFHLMAALPHYRGLHTHTQKQTNNKQLVSAGLLVRKLCSTTWKKTTKTCSVDKVVWPLFASKPDSYQLIKQYYFHAHHSNEYTV